MPDAQPYLEECQKLKDSILENYKQFMTFIGDDANKLKFEEFIQLMLKFRRDLEVNLLYGFLINLFYLGW